MFVSVTLDLLHPEMAYLPGALGWFRRSNLVNCVKLCHTVSHCVTLCQLCVFRLNTPCVTPSCTKAKNPAGMVMMRLKDMRNGIFRGMILGGKKVASFEKKTACQVHELRLRVVFQFCPQLGATKFVTGIQFTVDVSAEVCNGKESAGICQEVSTRHAGRRAPD